MQLSLLAEMSAGLIAVLVVVGVIVLIILWMIAVYNALVALRNQFKNAFAQIDVQLRRRYDLIPNLVETVKGYMAHERDTLEAVIAARNSAYSAGQKAAANPGDPESMKALNQAESQLSGTLGRLMMLTEAYPDLKANTTMASLQEELTATENKIGFSRQAFNDSATVYNTKRESFPSNVVAGMFGFGPAQLLEVIEAPQMREAPKVSFNK